MHAVKSSGHSRIASINYDIQDSLTKLTMYWNIGIRFIHYCNETKLNSLMGCAVHVLAAPTPTTFSAATDTLS